MKTIHVMKKFFGMLMVVAMVVAAPLAMANNDNDKDTHIGFWAGVFARGHWDDNDWPCYHMGWGRWFARGWLKTHGQNCPPVADSHDTTDPNIKDISVSSITQSSAIVNVSTDEPVSVVVEYGTSDDYGKTATESDYNRSQNVAILGLSANTRYHYRVTVRDRAGNTSKSDDRSFVTNDRSTNDNGNPEFSSINASSITTQSAVISWTTDENASGVVEYGTTGEYGVSVSATAMRKDHSVTLRNLKADTVYHYHIIARDADGNKKVSDDRTFKTDAGDVTPPVISGTNIVNVTDSSVRITWNTDERATSRVYYASMSPVMIGSARVVSNTELTTSHSLTISNLNPGAPYYFIIESVDANGNIRVTSDMVFTTK